MITAELDFYIMSGEIKMDEIYFSAKNNGFFSSLLHAKLPDDAVKINAALYRELLAGQENGKQIAADKSGNPVLIDHIPLLEEEFPLPDITKRQIKLWLLQKGKNPKKYPDEVIARITDEFLQTQAEIEWEDGDSYSRDSEFVKALAAALNWPRDGLDAAWKEIASIE